MTRGTGLKARIGVAAVTASLATMVLAAGVFAQEGACEVTVTPASVAVGQRFTVAGNFGGAEIYIVAGANANIPEGATPDATTAAGGSFSVQFTAEASDVGELTVWGLIAASECGDSAALTVTSAPSNTATADSASSPLIPAMGIMAISLVALALGVIATRRRNLG